MGFLPASSQNGRGEVLRGRLLHDPPDRRAAGEENQVPLLRQQRGCLRDPALGDGDRPRIQVLREHSASCAVHASDISDGLTTAVLPAAIAATSRLMVRK